MAAAEQRTALNGRGKARIGRAKQRQGRAWRGVAEGEQCLEMICEGKASQGAETQRVEMARRGTALHRMAAELNGYDQRRHAKDYNGIEPYGTAMASGRRAEKSKGMALRCMGSDARRWLSNDTGSNGKDAQRCAERCNDEQRNGKERLRNARDEHGREKQGQGSARIGNDPQGQ